MKTTIVYSLFILAFSIVLPASLQAQAYTPPVGCIAWYDGCNWCSTAPSGGAACSMRACTPEGMQAPYCSASIKPETPVQAPRPSEVVSTYTAIATEEVVNAATSAVMDSVVAPVIAETQEAVGWVTWALNIIRSLFGWL